MYGFTFTQIMNYRAYEAVCASQKFNMCDPRAKTKTGLTKDEFLFVAANYDALRAQSEEEIRELTMTSNLANQFDVHF